MSISGTSRISQALRLLDGIGILQVSSALLSFSSLFSLQISSFNFIFLLLRLLKIVIEEMRVRRRRLYKDENSRNLLNWIKKTKGKRQRWHVGVFKHVQQCRLFSFLRWPQPAGYIRGLVLVDSRLNESSDVVIAYVICTLCILLTDTTSVNTLIPCFSALLIHFILVLAG